MQHLAAVVLAAVAAALLVLSAAVVSGLASEYGAGAVVGLVWAVLVLVPAGLALLCLVGARDPVGPPRPRTSVLAAGVVLVFSVTGAAAVAYGDSAYEPVVEGPVCPEADVALLESVDAPGARSAPVLDGDGGCTQSLWGVPDRARATADVVAALERDGWRTTAGDAGAQVFRRGTEALHLSAESDGTATNVRLTVP